MPILCFMLACAACAASLQAQNTYDSAACAARLAGILIASYDGKPAEGPVEAAVKYFGRSGYINLLQTWMKERHDLEGFTPKIDMVYQGVLSRVRTDAPWLALTFEEAVLELTKVALLNLEIYHEALMFSRPKPELSLITPDDVSGSVLRIDYKTRIFALIGREESAKDKIRSILTEPVLSPKLGFYIYLFDVISGMRKKSLEALRSSLASVKI